MHVALEFQNKTPGIAQMGDVLCLAATNCHLRPRKFVASMRSRPIIFVKVSGHVRLADSLECLNIDKSALASKSIFTADASWKPR
jgi:hypothetical protein